MSDSTRSATATPGLPPRVGHILRLAEIIREVDGTHDLGAAALAEAILAHPGFSGCHGDPVAAAVQGVQADRYEFSVVDSDDCEVAGGSAATLDDAIREGRNYLSQYNQDGPHRLELRRVLVLDCSEPANVLRHHRPTMLEPDFRAALKQLADAVDGWEMEPAGGDPLAIAMDHARNAIACRSQP